MDTEVCNKIYPELSSRVESHGFHCIGFECVQEDGQNVLRLYLENDVGVDLLGCESVSRDISQYLDTVEDLLPSHYLLEVTSPGLERPLFCAQDFINNIGHIIEFTLTGKQSVVGEIIDANESCVKIDVESEILEPTYGEIKNAHLVFTLNKGEKKTFKKNDKKKKYKERKHK